MSSRIGRVGRALLFSVVIVGFTGPISAQEPQRLYTFCLIPQDHNARTVERGLCDSAAEASGYQMGVVRPCGTAGGGDVVELCAKCLENPDGPQPQQYECVGVGQQQ